MEHSGASATGRAGRFVRACSHDVSRGGRTAAPEHLEEVIGMAAKKKAAKKKGTKKKAAKKKK